MATETHLKTLTASRHILEAAARSNPEWARAAVFMRAVLVATNAMVLKASEIALAHNVQVQSLYQTLHEASETLDTLEDVLQFADMPEGHA